MPGMSAKVARATMFCWTLHSQSNINTTTTPQYIFGAYQYRPYRLLQRLWYRPTTVIPCRHDNKLTVGIHSIRNVGLLCHTGTSKPWRTNADGSLVEAAQLARVSAEMVQTKDRFAYNKQTTCKQSHNGEGTPQRQQQSANVTRQTTTCM